MYICVSHHDIIVEVITRNIIKIKKAYVKLPRKSLFNVFILRVSEIILLYSKKYSFPLLLKLLSLIRNLIISTPCVKINEIS